MQQQFLTIMHKGGPVMWPLLCLSILSVSLTFERCWFWLRQNGPAGRRGYLALLDACRRADRGRAQALAETGNTVYAGVTSALMRDGCSDSVAVSSVETERIRMDRFMATLSTIITAAPMLGILGTVTGIISSFELLSGGEAMVDPKAVSGGIAEALVATASGLIVALLALFPYMGFGAQREITIGRLESLIAVAQLAWGASIPAPGGGETPAPQERTGGFAGSRSVGAAH
ncbi:MAG: MotA/TolQ/ExbB proton channel family protein [Phycisphaerales bacterium]